MSEEINCELDEIYVRIKQKIKEENNLPQDVISLWFDAAQLVFLSDEEAILNTVTNFKRNILSSEKYHKMLLRAFESILGFPITVKIHSIEEENKMKEKMEKVSDGKTDMYSTVGSSRVLNHASIPSAFNEYTFDNFIVGKSNQMAAAAAKAVSESPGSIYNPLFIYGPSGLGKTHLLYAMTGKLCANFPDRRIVYVKGEDFTNQLIQAITRRQNEEFRERYRSCDVLLIDDIQFIAGKNSTQIEFFNTFNDLFESKKQIILASDRPPKDIETLEDRLKTRFESGLMVDIQPPDFELRTAILQMKAAALKISLPQDVLEYIAQNLSSNVRQLEGAVKKIYAQSLLTGAPITIDLAIGCISDHIIAAEPIYMTSDRILGEVSSRFGVTVDELKGKSRVAKIALARHVAVYIIKKLTDQSLPAIGRIFNRNHTTVIASIDAVEKRMEEDVIFKNDINNIISICKGN